MDKWINGEIASEEYIVDVLQNRANKEEALLAKVNLCIEAINKIESQDYKDAMLAAQSLKGIPSDLGRTSRTNTRSDVSQILEGFQRLQDEEKKFYVDMLHGLIGKFEQISEIWRCYIGLESKLFQVLKLRYVENQKWEAIRHMLGLSNQQISDRLHLGIEAIQYELVNGEGSSRNSEFTGRPEYRKALKRKECKESIKKGGPPRRAMLRGLDGEEE